MTGPAGDEQDRHGRRVTVDLGGTKILTLAFDAAGNVVGEDRRASASRDGADAVIARVCASIEAVLDGRVASGIGVAAAGVIDRERGTANSVNLSNWQDLPIVTPLQSRFRCPVLLENDCNAAAWGESLRLDRPASATTVYLGLGTGVGGGIVRGGSRERPVFQNAAELGHIPLDPTGPRCGCGSHGCLEQYASGTAIVREAERRGVRAEAGPLTGERVHAAALAGDSFAADVIGEASLWLGRGLVAITNMLGPEWIVIGGGVANMGPMLLEPAIAEVRAHAMRPFGESVKIATAVHGERSACMGLSDLLRHGA